MLDSNNLLNIAFYMLRTVMVRFLDQSMKTGILLNYDPIKKSIQLDENTFPIDSISDITHIAQVDDYHTYKGYGEIGNVKFYIEDLHPDFILSDLLYGEYICTVSCHLYLKDGEICAKDIRLVDKYHSLNYEYAKNHKLLYRYDNGSILIGNILKDSSEHTLKSISGELSPLNLAHVVDITRVPEVNDYVYVGLSTDKNEHCGLVSAVNGTMIVLVDSQGVPELIDLNLVTTIKYRGTVSFRKTLVNGKTTRNVMIAVGSSKEDDSYLCKLPYARDSEAFAHIKEGDLVTFIAGINDRCCIAKDADIIKSKENQERDSQETHEYYGVIITVNFSKDNGYGFVGNRYVSKVCGKSVPGHARFNRDQLDFKIEINKVYVVKYTVFENESDGLRIIDKMYLHQVLDSAYIGIIDVSDDGIINATPLYQVVTTFFENRDVDIYCTDGRIISGKIIDYSDIGIIICSEPERVEEAELIPFSEINDVRIIGTVSKFYPNGTGYVDNTFFFHINEMEKSIDAKHVRRGTQVSFKLRNSRKGNYVDCGSIRVLPGKNIECYVLAYQNQKYMIVDVDKYGRNIHFFDEIYAVPFSGYNTLSDLSNKDYRVNFTIQRRNGLDICTNVKVLESKPKLRYGIVTALNREKNTISITSPSTYRKNASAAQYLLALQGQADLINDTKKKDYQVLYNTTVQNNTTIATVVWVDLKDTYDKCFYGYIELFPEDRTYVWITPDEFISVPVQQRPKKIGVYCRKSAFVEIPENVKLYNSNYVLRVCYTLDFDRKITAFNPKPPAKQVWILESIDRPVFSASSIVPIPISIPEPKLEKRVIKTETKLVSEMVSISTALDGKEYEYGLINIYTSQYALINAQYYNRKYAPENDYDMSKTVYFVPEKTIITPEQHLKTGTYSYLVRYVKTGTVINPATGLEQPTVDSSLPIEVVYAFSKSQCASIILENDKIRIEYVGESMPDPNDEAPEIALGESLYFKLVDGNVCYGVYSGEDDNSYFLSDGKAIDKTAVSRLFRFGVISALSLENGIATINNYFDFSLTVAEPKMLSILKNQKSLVRLHVMYSSVDGKITEVCRLSKRCLGCLIWDSGIVTELDKTSHSITIDASIRHYLTVMSDGVNAYVNNGSILNREVFVKQVFHPYLEASDAEPGIVASAVDVRCQEEELRIQYDEGRDVYLGYRNSTTSFPVFGSARVLQEKIDEIILVSFRVSSDMYNLEAYIDDDSNEPTEDPDLTVGSDSGRISHEALALLLLQKEDIEQVITGKTRLNPDSDQSQVQRAVNLFISKSKHLSAIRIAMAYPQYEVLDNMENLFRTEMQTKCTAVGLDPNSYYGEQAYYITTVLHYPTSARIKGRYSNSRFSNYDYLYRLFSQDFESREQLVKYLQGVHSARKANLAYMFRKPCSQVGELVAHIVLLDKLNLEAVCSLIKNNKTLSEEVIKYAKEVDDTISEQNVSAVVSALQDRYLHDKRRFADRIISLISKENICDDLKKILLNMQNRFLKLICKEDNQRFETLLEICSDVIGYINVPGFIRQEQLLQHAYREACLLEEDILTHPCKESVEILMYSAGSETQNNILGSVKREIISLLNRLYKDVSRPRIQCRVNENSIAPDAKTFWLIVENGSQNENLQPAGNLQIELESFTEDFMLQKKVHLLQNRLACGEHLAVEIKIDLGENVSGVLEFGWTAHYEYTAEFMSDGSINNHKNTQESDHPLQLQIVATASESKKIDVDNPYFDPARGQPLIGKEMFFGRETEKQKILECICVNSGEKHFISGSAVIIHGQKKSGKTSLVNQIKNYIKDDECLSQKAIILNFSNILDETGGVELLHCFKRTFYAVIMSRLEDEICENHPDIADKMDEAGLEVPDLLSADSQDVWSAQFDKFFRDFLKMDNEEHSIILFMDEFTLLCTTIMAEIQRAPEKASLSNIPNFIKTFSQYGFIQVIIGHEAMMRALNTLGVLNHTAEFAKTIEISALDEEASRALVTQPMLDKFGYDVYSSELGKQAVDLLLDLSGRNPAYLMRLCNKMFMYYTDPQKCPRTQLLVSDVNAMLQEYTGELLLSDFDILLMEDGDDTVEAEKRITYHYLKCAALLSISSYDKRTADSSEITSTLSRDNGYSISEIDKTRNILEARRVISITNGGRVKINTGLFAEYIQQKNGLKKA